MKSNVPATCHPNKPAVSKGLCNACYMRAYRNGGVLPSTPAKVYGVIPTCHPDRPHRAHSLCNECYLKSQYEKRADPDRKRHRKHADCHPDRAHKARGLCNECYKKEPDRVAYSKKYSAENTQRDQLKHKYGLSVEQYDAMVLAQNGVCAICKQPPRGKMKRLSVDHDHVTGKVRGLLCITCNRVLGFFENAEWHWSANKYIARS